MKVFSGKKCVEWIVIPTCVLSVTKFGLIAATATFETIGFTPVVGGDVIGETYSWWVGTHDNTAFSAENSRDYVIFDSLSYLTYDENDENDEDDEDDDTRISYSAYHGYNSATGEELDEGALIMECSIDEDTLSGSNIVGFIRTSGPWTTKEGSFDTTLAEASGTISFNTLEKARDVEIVFNGSGNGHPFKLYGESTSTVYSEDSVSIGAWEADADSDYEFAFSSTTLTRWDGEGNQYHGLIRRSDSEDPEEWITKYALIQVTDPNDTDEDGIPDLSDLGAEQILGILATNSLSIGDDQIWSDDLETYVYYDPAELWLYGENLGWFYLPDQNDTDTIRIYIPDESLGWLWTNEDLSPVYIRESDEVKIYFVRIEGVVWYYDYTSETWSKIAY